MRRCSRAQQGYAAPHKMRDAVGGKKIVDCQSASRYLKIWICRSRGGVQLRSDRTDQLVHDFVGSRLDRRVGILLILHRRQSRGACGGSRMAAAAHQLQNRPKVYVLRFLVRTRAAAEHQRRRGPLPHRRSCAEEDGIRRTQLQQVSRDPREARGVARVVQENDAKRGIPATGHPLQLVHRVHEGVSLQRRGRRVAVLRDRPLAGAALHEMHQGPRIAVRGGVERQAPGVRMDAQGHEGALLDREAVQAALVIQLLDDERRHGAHAVADVLVGAEVAIRVDVVVHHRDGLRLVQQVPSRPHPISLLRVDHPHSPQRRVRLRRRGGAGHRCCPLRRCGVRSTRLVWRPSDVQNLIHRPEKRVADHVLVHSRFSRLICRRCRRRRSGLQLPAELLGFLLALFFRSPSLLAPSSVSRWRLAGDSLLQHS
eukprot:scaffold1462_cov260-Pinguiococcus_pyrenoidosus.AAC.10